jgi:hypothetical protein
MTPPNLSKRKRFNEDQVTPEQVNPHLRPQGLEEKEGKSIVAKPISIINIWPDIKQPRRAIPLAVRGEWDGNPEYMPAVLNIWTAMTLGELSADLTLKDFINGSDKVATALEDVTLPPLTQDYLDLLSLAGDILRHGLENPIAVVERGDYVIESGERRWVAHHILTHAGFKGFDKVNARVQPSQGAVWRQASENGIRKPLNAIGLARQLALLIMDMYEGDDGVTWDDYHTLVTPGGSDRPFYAQVKNGQVWSIKKGFAQRILDATGLKNKSQISRYRALLDIPDELWVQADNENWAEGAIRNYLNPVDRLPIGNLSDDVFPQEDGDDNHFTEPDNMVAKRPLSADDVIVGGEYRAFERKGFSYGSNVVIDEETQVYRFTAQGLVPTGQVIVHESGKYQETYEYANGQRFDCLYLFTGRSVIIDAGCIRRDTPGQQPQQKSWSGEQTPHNKGRDWYAGAPITITHNTRPLDIDRGQVVTLWSLPTILANTPASYKRSIIVNTQVLDFVMIDNMTYLLDAKVVKLNTSSQINADDGVHPRKDAPVPVPAPPPTPIHGKKTLEHPIETWELGDNGYLPTGKMLEAETLYRVKMSFTARNYGKDKSLTIITVDRVDYVVETKELEQPSPAPAPRDNVIAGDNRHSATPFLPDHVTNAMNYFGRYISHDLREMNAALITMDEHGLKQWIDEVGAETVHGEINALSHALAASASSIIDDINAHLTALWNSVTND